MSSLVKRGDMYYADLNPVVGSEQGGIRPVLIIQNNLGNRHSPTVVVAAITSKLDTKANLQTHYPISTINGLEKDSLVLLEQIRTIDKKRLRQYIGTIGSDYMKGIDRALSISMGLNNESE